MSASCLFLQLDVARYACVTKTGNLLDNKTKYVRKQQVLERMIEKIIRKAAVILVSKESKKVTVNSKNLVDFLGKKKFHYIQEQIILQTGR